jgi:ribonuclease HII
VAVSDWRELLASGALVAGVDEAGRGPLAGDVIAAAVILDADALVPGLRDSKLISHARRPTVAACVREQAVAWALGRASVAEIDRLNILQASLLAMRRAVAALAIAPHFVLVDGNRCPDWTLPSLAVVGGDRLVPAISAASVLAKVARDEEMVALDAVHPGYGFARHKGYPTADHLDALRRLGVSPVHRQSFAPVAALIAQGGLP